MVDSHQRTTKETHRNRQETQRYSQAHKRQNTSKPSSRRLIRKVFPFSARNRRLFRPNVSSKFLISVHDIFKIKNKILIRKKGTKKNDYKKTHGRCNHKTKRT